MNYSYVLDQLETALEEAQKRAVLLKGQASIAQKDFHEAEATVWGLQKKIDVLKAERGER